MFGVISRSWRANALLNVCGYGTAQDDRMELPFPGNVQQEVRFFCRNHLVSRRLQESVAQLQQR